jgi:large subunit GTPase 1
LIFIDNRGFMTQNGQPDNARSARYILKDFVDGKLLYCSAPPNYSQNKFHTFTLEKKIVSTLSNSSQTIQAFKFRQSKIQDLEEAFFQKRANDIHIKGIHIKLNRYSFVL